MPVKAIAPKIVRRSKEKRDATPVLLLIIAHLLVVYSIAFAATHQQPPAPVGYDLAAGL